jgi:hypothetical protein
LILVTRARGRQRYENVKLDAWVWRRFYASRGSRFEKKDRELAK